MRRQVEDTRRATGLEGRLHDVCCQPGRHPEQDGNAFAFHRSAGQTVEPAPASRHVPGVTRRGPGGGRRQDRDGGATGQVKVRVGGNQGGGGGGLGVYVKAQHIASGTEVGDLDRVGEIPAIVERQHFKGQLTQGPIRCQEEVVAFVV